MISFLVRYYANAIRSAESLQEVASLLAEAKAELSAIKTKVQTEGTGEAPAISLQTATIAGIPNQPCTGKAITPKVTVRAAGKTLISGVDFTATYSNNKEIGKATVRITAKSNAFSGSKTASFKIVPARTSITTITRKTGGKVNVAWKKVSASQKITRYQLRFRISGTTNWSYRSLSPTASSRGLAKLKKGTIYQFQVRSWKTINRVQYFSDWSPTAVSQKIR